MATVEECHDAVQTLATRLSQLESGDKRNHDRTLSCRIPDIGVTFFGRLTQGRIEDLTTEARPRAQIRLTVHSDDLVAMTTGGLHAGTAFTSGRLRVEASILDLLRLRSMFSAPKH